MKQEAGRLAREIEELESKLKAVAGGKIAMGRSEDCPDELHKRFLESVLAFETTPEVVPFDLLAESGLALPPPAEVSDERVHAQLHQVIDAMSLLGIYLLNTDHLSDRELYHRLWGEILREPTALSPHIKGSACHVDLVGSGSREDVRLYLKYYADEDVRRNWGEDYPDDDIPPHQDPPYDRDRNLPAPQGWRIA